MTHTKTPWSYEPQEFIPERIWAGTRLIAQVVGDSAETQENAAFIVRAVNSHDKLVETLEAIALLTPDPVARDAARAALREAKGG